MHRSRQEDFELLVPITATRAEFSFSGEFQGKPALWLEAQPSGYSDQQSIEISSENPGEYVAEVRLNITQVDLPAIRKTILMMRNYKRLRLGRHEFAGSGKPANGII